MLCRVVTRSNPSVDIVQSVGFGPIPTHALSPLRLGFDLVGEGVRVGEMESGSGSDFDFLPLAFFVGRRVWCSEQRLKISCDQHRGPTRAHHLPPSSSTEVSAMHW
jgi:hypothetical protein